MPFSEAIIFLMRGTNVSIFECVLLITRQEKVSWDFWCCFESSQGMKNMFLCFWIWRFNLCIHLRVLQIFSKINECLRGLTRCQVVVVDSKRTRVEQILLVVGVAKEFLTNLLLLVNKPIFRRSCCKHSLNKTISTPYKCHSVIIDKEKKSKWINTKMKMVKFQTTRKWRTICTSKSKNYFTLLYNELIN